MKAGLLQLLPIATLVLTAPWRSKGADLVWTNLLGGSWNIAANWRPAQVPGAGDNVFITNNGTYAVTISVDAAVNAVLVGGLTGTQSLVLNGGTFAVGTAGTIGTNAVFSLSAGVLAGAGNVSVLGTLNWTGGTMGGAGRTVLASGAAAAVTSGFTKGLNRAIDNSGTLTYSGTGLAFGLGEARAGVVNNLAGGVVNVTDQGDFNRSFAAAHAVNNAGTFNKRGTNTSTEFSGVPFHNTGLVNLTSGTMVFSGGGSNAAQFATSPGTVTTFLAGYAHPAGGSLTGGGAVDFTSGTHPLTGQLTTTGTVTCAGATVVIDTPQSLAALTFSSGVITGIADLTITGTCNWSSGTMSGTGRTILNPGSTASLTGQSGKGLNRTLDNSGIVTYSGTALTFGLGAAGPGTVNNLPGGTFSVTGDGDFNQSFPAAHAFNNLGTFNKGGAGTTTEFNGVPVNNSGAVTVAAGTFDLNGGGTNSAGIDVAAGATLRLGATFVHSAGSALGGAGNFSFNNGTHDFLGQFLPGGSVSFLGGSVTIANTMPVVPVTVGGATVTFQVSQTFSSLSLNSGTLQGAGDITITGLFNWAAGSMAGSGHTLLGAAASANITGGSQKGLSRALDNSGTITYSGSFLILGFPTTGPGIINNLPGGSFSISGEADIHLGASFSHAFNNQGTFTKSGAGTSSELNGTVFNNSGSVTVASGTLTLGAGGTNTAAIDLAAGTTLNLAGGFGLPASGTITGAGAVNFNSGPVTVAGRILTSGAVGILGASVDVSAPQTLAALTLSNGGTLQGGANVTITGTFNWSSGTMGGSGRTILAAGGTATLSTLFSVKGLNRIFDNFGSVTYSGSFLFFGYTAATPGVINNLPGASFAVTGDGDFDQSTAAAHAFNNSGTFTKAGAGSTADFNSVACNNSGTVTVTGGTLNFNGGGTNHTTMEASAGSTLGFGNSFQHPAGSTLGGAGIITFGNGTHQFAGQLLPTGTVHFRSGTITVNNSMNVATGTISGATVTLTATQTLGSLTFSAGTLQGNGDVTVTGTFNWNAGTMAGGGRTILAAGGTGEIAGGGSLKGVNRQFDNFGTVTYSGLSLAFGLGAAPAPGVINNFGVFHAVSDGDFSQGATAAHAFNNHGTFNKRGSNTVTDFTGVALNNSNLVRIVSGTLSPQSLSFPGAAVLQGDPGGTLRLGSATSLTGTTTNAAQWAPLGRVLFDQFGAHHLEVMSSDLGNLPAAYTNNFAYGTIELGGGATLVLTNTSDNSPGAEALYVDTLIVPAGTTLNMGNLHVYVRNTQISGIITNGTLSVAVGEQFADLQVESLGVAATASVAEPVNLTWTVRNTTNASATTPVNIWQDRIVLSPDAIPGNADDRTLATLQHAGALAVGEAYITNTTVTLPGDLRSNLNFFVIVDSGNTVYESRFETNNTSAARIIFVQTPDLAPGSLVAPVTGVAGLPVAVSWSVTNLGPGTAWTDWADRIYISTNATWDAADQLLLSEPTGNATPLPAGSGYTLTRNVTLPGAFFGSNHLILVVDGSLNQLETTETNNTAVAPIVIQAADLEVTALEVSPALLQSGTDVVIRWNDFNSGVGPAGGFWYDQVVVSNLTTGVKLTEATIHYDGGGSNAIPTGQGRPRQFTFRLPDGAAGAGQLQFRVRTDFFNHIPESNPGGGAEGNNLAVLTRLSSLVPYPDLLVTNLAVTPTNLQSGVALVFSWQKTNSGNGAVTSPFYERLTIRNRTTAEVFADTFLFYDPASTNEPIAAGQVRTRAYPFQLPDGPRGAGELEFTVASDVYNHIFEYNPAGTGESNNVARLVVNSALAPYPDLIATNINGLANESSGRPVEVTWTTVNRGTATTPGPWIEQVFLSDDPVVGGDVYLGTFSRSAPLAAGGSLTSTGRFTLPDFVAGDRFLVVKVDAGGQVFELDENNNAAVASQPILLPASLSLAFPAPSFPESGGASAITGTVTRNTGTSTGLVVSLSVTDTNIAGVAPTVVIPAGRVAASFAVAAIDNSIAEGSRSVMLTASAPGFTPVTGTLTATDNDIRGLTLQLGPTNVAENTGPAASLGIVTRNAETTTALVVTLTSDRPGRLAVPASLTLAIGQRSAVFQIDSVDNDLLDGDARVNVQAGAPGYAAVSGSITVTDDDAAALTLAISLASTSVAEGAGSPATIGTVTRSLVNGRDLPVSLSSTPGGQLLLPSRLTIRAGEASASFNVNVPDDASALGSRSVAIMARAVTDAGSPLDSSAGSVALQVQDNDGPTLALTLSSALVAEGSTVTGTVTRNTATGPQLLVALSSSLPGEAAVPPVVTIRSNQAAATFTIAGVPDNESDGIKPATLVASAAGFNDGSATLNVSDIDVPDLRVGTVTAPTNALTDTFLSIAWTTTNSGLAPSSGSWVDHILLSQDPHFGNDTLLGSAAFNGTLAVGDSYSRTQQVRLPSSPGTYWILLVTDAGGSVTEGAEFNNVTVAALPVVIAPAYRAMVSTDVEVAANGTPILMRGHASNTTDGSPARFKIVTTRIAVQGSRRVMTSVSDENGDFRVTFQPLPTEAGHYTIGADHPLVIEDVVQDQFTILGMKALPERLSVTLIPNEPLSGQIELRNLGEIPLTGLTAAATAPPGVTVELDVPGELAGMSSTPLRYTISSTVTQQASANFLIRVSSAEGVTLGIVGAASITPLRPQLAANPAFISRGILRGTQTVESVEIVNHGGAPSGDLRVVLPDLPWMSLMSGSNLGSLRPGERATVTLGFNPPADLPLQRYDGNLGIIGASASLSVPFQLRALSAALGDLLVTVTDEYTFFVADAPKVTNATVRVRDPYNGRLVAEGTSEAGGRVLFPQLPEGVYSLEVTAERHAPFRGPVTIVPGTTNVAEPFISRQTVSYQWNVVPLEIQDTYRVVVESVFETDVPIPTVVIENPRIMPLVVSGMETHFEIRIRNEGLIAANNVRLSVPQDPRFIVTPLVDEIGTLPAKGSVSIPVTIRHRGTPPGRRVGLRSSFDRTRAVEGCEAEVHDCLPKIPLSVGYTYKCGPNNNLKVQPIDLTPICTAQDIYKCLEKLLGAAEAAAASGNLLDAACETLEAILQCAGADLSECEKAALLAGCKTLVAGPVGLVSSIGDSLGCICDLLSALFDWLDFSFDEVELSGGIQPKGSLFIGVVTWGATGGTSGGCDGPGGGGGGGAGKALSPRAGTRATTPGNACARVRIGLEQDAVMTRSAFLGTLEIDNDGLDTISGIRVTLDFRDAAENSVSDRFAFREPQLTGLADVNGGGSVGPSGSASVRYTFIPTRDAAPTAPVTYHIGGTLRYLEGGQEVVVPLLSSVITVFPEARLELKYFQQRDVFSDDPSTLEKEPAEPFALGIIAKNNGAGAAKNFRISSAQPKIIENEKGLAVDFRIIGTQVGTQALAPTLTASFGTIPPGQSQVAQWLFTSSLHGKFTEYSARFEHVDSLGSANLSLIDSVEIHELIHAVRTDRPGDDAVPDFLVNDDPDPDNFPDRLYLSDGTTAVVNAALNPVADNTATLGNPVVHLTASMSTGWNYLRMNDPGPGLELQRVTRPDGRELRVGDNVWQTDRTFPASQSGAVRERRLHLLDFDGTGSYTLHYRLSDTTPPVIIDVAAVEPDPRTNAVSSVDVVLSEVVNPAQFDFRDLTLTLNGGPNLIDSSVTVTLVSNTTYRIHGLAALTGADGNYELRVLAGGITDFGGNAVTNSFSRSWAKAAGGPVIVSLQAVSPNPRNTPVTTLDVVFSQPVDPATFDAADLTLTRNGGLNLAGTLSVAAVSPTTFRIIGLTELTAGSGAYVLAVHATNVLGLDGRPGTGARSQAWTTDAAGPVITGIERLATNPRNTVVSALEVTFSEAIDPATFDFRDLTLTRNGGVNLVTSAVRVNPVNATTFQVANFNPLVGVEGTYTLTVNGANISDPAGNRGAGTAAETWVMDTTAPLAPANLHIVPDHGVSASDGLSNTNNPTLNGSLAETNLTVRVFDVTTGTDLGAATAGGTTFSHALALQGAGTHRLRVHATDAAGNVSANSFLDLFVDVQAPTLALAPVVPDPRTNAVVSIDVTASEPLNPDTLDHTDLSLTRGDSTNNLISGAVVVQAVTSDLYRITGLASLTEAVGSYRLTLNTATVEDRAGNPGAGRLTTAWTRLGINTAPRLAAIPGQFIAEKNVLSFTVSATDTDLPPNVLTFSLDPGAPIGAAINPTNGLFTWTPTELQGPEVYPVTVRVTDNGSPHLGATSTFNVSVGEVNERPVLNFVSNRLAFVGVTVTLTNTATDPDRPANQLTFGLGAGAPAGAQINPASGLFTWTPSGAQAGTTNHIPIVVTDGGGPPLSDTRIFTVIVRNQFDLFLGSTITQAGQAGSVPLFIAGNLNVTNLSFGLEAPAARLAGLALFNPAPQVGSLSLTPAGGDRFAVRVGAAPGQLLPKNIPMVRLAFTSVSHQASAFVPLRILDLDARQADGTPVEQPTLHPGRVVVIGGQPLVEALVHTNAQRTVTLYGIPGRDYALETTTNLADQIWAPFAEGRLTNQFWRFDAVPAHPNLFYRAREQ